LFKTLSKKYKDLPSLPGKTIFKLREEKQIEERKISLEKWLNNCIQR